MLDLLVNSLRMRPDRIVMGEIRRKNEAEVLFEAMHTGHSVYSTIHADTGSQVLKRLIEPPIEVPGAEVEDLHLVLVQYRDRRKNIRRTLELSEVIERLRRSGAQPHLHMEAQGRRVPVRQAAPPLHAGAEPPHGHDAKQECNDDQQSKASVLKWMEKNALENIEDVGRVMKLYYSEPETITEAAARRIRRPRRCFEGLPDARKQDRLHARFGAARCSGSAAGSGRLGAPLAKCQSRTGPWSPETAHGHRTRGLCGRGARVRRSSTAPDLLHHRAAALCVRTGDMGQVLVHVHPGGGLSFWIVLFLFHMIYPGIIMNEDRREGEQRPAFRAPRDDDRHRRRSARFSIP